MAETTLQAGNSAIGTIRIDPLQISSEGGPDIPILRILVKLALLPNENPTGGVRFEPSPTVRHYTITQLSGRAFFTGLGGVVQIAGFTAGPVTLRTDGGEQPFNIDIELDPFRVRRIEEQREGDFVLRLDITWLLMRHPEVQRGKWDGTIEGIETAWTQIPGIQIPQSHWIRLRPKLGYGKVEIVEIPVPEKVVPESFSRALTELSEARSDLAQGNYDNVVGHCRNAVEYISKALPYPEVPGGGSYPSFRQRITHLLRSLDPLLVNVHDYFPVACSSEFASCASVAIAAVWSAGLGMRA